MPVRIAKTTDLPTLIGVGAEYIELMQGSQTVDVLTLTGNVRNAIESPFEELFVYEDDAGLQGFLWATGGAALPWTPSVQAYDRMLFLKESGRSFVAVASLVRAYLAWAGEKGCTEASLSSISGIQPERTRKLFNKLGFSDVGFYNTKKLGG